MSSGNPRVNTIAPWWSRESYGSLPHNLPVYPSCSWCSPGFSFIHVGTWLSLLLAPPRSPQPLSCKLQDRGGSLCSPEVPLAQHPPSPPHPPSHPPPCTMLECSTANSAGTGAAYLSNWVFICFFHFASFILLLSFASFAVKYKVSGNSFHLYLISSRAFLLKNGSIKRICIFNPVHLVDNTVLGGRYK